MNQTPSTEDSWLDEILHELVHESKKLDYQYIRRESTRHNKKNALHHQAKAVIKAHEAAAVKAARIDEFLKFYTWVQSEGRLFSEIKAYYEIHVAELSATAGKEQS
jgi:hypothetical protein